MAKFKPTREFYIPKGGVRVADKNSTAVCYMIGKDNYHVVMGFAGKRQKPDFHYRFTTLENAQAYVAKFFEDVQAAEDHKAQTKQREAERLAKMRDKIKAGDIYYTSWGYDQTNIDFYLVVDRTAATVEVVKIGKDCVEAVTGVDYVTPNPLVKWGDTIKRKINTTGFKIASYAYAYPWEGDPKQETAAGWGH
jgi:hypothetical protein